MTVTRYVSASNEPQYIFEAFTASFIIHCNVTKLVAAAAPKDVLVFGAIVFQRHQIKTFKRENPPSKTGRSPPAAKTSFVLSETMLRITEAQLRR